MSKSLLCALPALLILAFAADYGFAQEATQLQIEFKDTVKPLSVGKEIRFVVVGKIGGDRGNVDISLLEFTFKPEGWGEVKSGPDKTTGIIEVKKLVSAGDIFDETEYVVRAAFKGEGEGAIRDKNRFKIALGLPIIELKFFYSGGGNWTEFDERSLARLDVNRSFEVSHPDIIKVIAMEGKFYVKFLKESDVKPSVTVIFPNGDRATLVIDISWVRSQMAESSGFPALTYEKLSEMLAKLRKDVELLDAFEGINWQNADNQKSLIRRDFTTIRGLIERATFPAGEVANLMGEYNDILNEAGRRKLGYREGGAGASGPLRYLELLTEHERLSWKFGNE
ncbi:MAG: hypothetical protein RDV41_12650 [Planctomycetota bacterium]|nr:hypothetical protein [Planctomycetota bacterium]